MAALAAINPVAALTSGSPTLQMFNPAVNPQAAFLAFDPASAAALAIAPEAFGIGVGPFGPFGGASKGFSPFTKGGFSPFTKGGFSPFTKGGFSPFSKGGFGMLGKGAISPFTTGKFGLF